MARRAGADQSIIQRADRELMGRERSAAAGLRQDTNGRRRRSPVSTSAVEQARSQEQIRAQVTDATRWGQLVFGIICMVMIANLQYGWTLFVGPIDQKYHWGRAAIQVVFTIIVLTETWLVPIEGYLIDKFGPRIMISG